MKATLKRLFRGFGVDVRHAHKHDAVVMQERLLAGKEVKTVFDVGAYHGEWTATYRRLFPAAHIFAFEPFPDSRNIVENAFKGQSAVTVCAAALGDVPGERSFYANRAAATNSLLRVDARTDASLVSHELLKLQSELLVPVLTIDQFCQEHGIDRLNLLKIDVQGAETLVLRGAADMLHRRAIDLIYTELQIMHHYEGQSYYFDVCDYLHRSGYDLYGLYNFAVSSVGRFGWADAIFVPR
jgi:FkbM family methyltransferase